MVKQSGDVVIATPATHLPHLISEESYGTNILKGSTSGLISFGVNPVIFQDLSIKTWGNEYFNIPSEDLYILCSSWINFKVEKQFASAWEVWLNHHSPKNP
jgi:hypothetical protein